MQTIELAIFLQFFLGLVAAVNPLGIMPIFVSLTGHMTLEEKRKTALTAHVAIASILIISLIGGQVLLDMFSISLDSFRVVGGLLILSIAFSMMSGKLGEDKQNNQERTESISREQIGVVHLRCLFWQALVQSVLPLFTARVTRTWSTLSVLR
ncbi:putative membrane protein [Vibrio ponticus]|nr:putative membrane protein [Vibrio ponticus]